MFDMRPSVRHEHGQPRVPDDVRRNASEQDLFAQVAAAGADHEARRVQVVGGLLELVDHVADTELRLRLDAAGLELRADGCEHPAQHAYSGLAVVAYLAGVDHMRDVDTSERGSIERLDEVQHPV